MPDPPQTVRIFISSPGDVIEERDGSRRVIEGLQRLYPGARLQSVFWEDLALPVTASFQETIDFLLEREPIDVAVFILWSRLGSPLGTSITRSDGTPYRSGTERELDLMLAAFEKSGRKRPVILAYVRDDDAAFKQKLTESPTSELEEFVSQRKLADAFIREQFHDAEGRNLRAYQTYRESVGFVQRLRLHLRNAIDDLLGADAAPSWTEEPYRGLEVFDVHHAPIFYGRDEEICQLLQRRRDQEQAGCAFVVIVGASGSGKSSLARAGIAASLIQNAGDDGVTKQWRVSTFIPALAAQDLCKALVRSIAETLPELSDSTTTLDDVAESLTENAALTVRLSIAPAFTRASEKAGGKVRLLLILDQLEELWTDRQTTSEDRDRFLAAIEALAQCEHVSVLATLRSDFYSHAQQMPAFLRLKGEFGHFDLLPPDAASVQRLITEPARLAGLQFERHEQTGRPLDEVILEDAARDPNALPLLQYTLAELYTQRDERRRLLTFDAYKQLGGVEGALAKRAKETFESLPVDAQDAMDEILPLLVSVDTTGEQAAVRRRASVADLTSTPARKTLTDHLTAARFLTTDRQDDTPIASLAHEALLRRWDRIVTWISANREQLGQRARVEASQQRWEQQDRDDSLLLAAGLPLDEGRQLLREAPYLVTETTAEYIRASVMKNRRRRRIVVSTVVVLLAAMIVGGITIRRANVQETRAAEATRLVQGLLQADTPQVTTILDDLADYRDLASDDLQAALADSAEDSNAKLHAALALLAEDNSVLPFLKERLLQAKPDQVETIVGLLENHKDEIVDDLWEVVEEGKPEQLLQAASALAIYDTDSRFSLRENNAKIAERSATINTRWSAVADRVVDALVKENPLRVAVWIKTLRPARHHLVAPLGAVYRDKSDDRSQTQIDLATNVLEDYAADDLSVLSELLWDAEPKQFVALFDEFKAHGENALSELSEELDRELTFKWNDSPLAPSWTEPAAEITAKIQQAHGMMAERFAFCQTMPLDEFQSVSDELRKSGYRPIRLRPYAHNDSVHVAAAWTRDGRNWQLATDQAVDAVQQRDQEQREDGFVAVDVAGYIGRKDDMPVELYAALWVKRDSDPEDARIYVGASYAEHASVYGVLEKEGYKFQHALQGFRGLGGQQKYCGVRTKAAGAGNWWWQQTVAGFEDKEYFDKIAWDIDPSNAPVPETTQERNENALADAEAKLMENAEDRNARFARGQANFYLGNNKESLADMAHLVQFAADVATSYQFRSILYARLGDAAAARADLQNFAERSSSLTTKAYLDVVVSAYLDEDSESITRLEALIGENREDDATLYDAACAYSIASGVFQGQDATKSKLYADRAVTLLQQAIAAGYDNDSHMQQDADLDSIRGHDGFIQIIKSGNVNRTYAAVWNENTRFEARELHGLSAVDHVEQCQAILAAGYRLVSISAAAIDGEPITASVWHRPLIADDVKEELARRQSNAAVAALRMNQADRVWPLLRHNSDPRLRTWIIHRLSPLGASPEKIVKRLDEEQDVSVRRALILILGESPEAAPIDRDSLSTKLLGLYRDDPDSGIHGAAEWVLRRWGKASELTEIETELGTGKVNGDRNWYCTKQGDTMALIPGPVEFLMGSPSTEKDRNPNEYLHRRRIGHSFAVATKEVSVRQFQEFLRQNPSVRHSYIKKYAPEEDCPQTGVTWYEAAAYCRWLSEQESIAEDQMCYPEIAEIKAGMKLPSDYLSRTGYRLPSEAEWEYACRSGADTSRYYGVADELLGQYAWFIETSDPRSWPVGSLIPNETGLFDMQGNVSEWCQELYVSYSLGSLSEDQEDTVSLSDTSHHVLRGGSFNDLASFVRSAYRTLYQPDNRFIPLGFRAARTYDLSP